MQAVPLNLIPEDDIIRYKTGVESFDKFLGGGLVQGSVSLFSGEPGVGKSSFLLQVSDTLSKQGHKLLYASGEENLGQIKLRATRLHITSPKVFCSDTLNLEQLLDEIFELDPQIIIVDSLQMLFSSTMSSAPGTSKQTKYCVDSLIDLARKQKKAIIIIGHSTKSGLIAGLLTIQHMVDATFFMTNSERGIKNVLAQKNRFGQSQTNWQIQMTERGFIDLLGKNNRPFHENIYEKIEALPEEKLEELEIPTEGKTYLVRLRNKSIEHALSDNWLKKKVVNNSMRWLFEKVFGTKELQNIIQYDIIYKLKK